MFKGVKEQGQVIAQLARSEDLTRYILCYIIDSKPFNSALRGEEIDNDIVVQSTIEAILSMFAIIENNHNLLYQPQGYTILYRGILPDVTFEQAANDCGFMSTSTKVEVAKEFANKYEIQDQSLTDKPKGKIMKIYLVNPYFYAILPVKYIGSECYKSESEVILAPGRGKLIDCGLDNDATDKTFEIEKFLYIPSDQSVDQNINLDEMLNGKTEDTKPTMFQSIFTTLKGVLKCSS